MMTDEEIQDFLSHHGVKGQRWGVKRQNLNRVSRVASGTSQRREIMKTKSAASGRRILGSLAIGFGTGTAAGTLAAKAVLHKSGDALLAQLAGRLVAFTGAGVTTHLLIKHGERKVSSRS